MKMKIDPTPAAALFALACFALPAQAQLHTLTGPANDLY